MDKDNQSDQPGGSNTPGFFATLIQGLIRDTVGLWISLLIGTIVGGVICLYLGAPLIYSLVGGLFVMAVYVAYDRL